MTLDLSENRHSGSLTSELKSLTSLRRLQVPGNQNLVGALPTSGGQLTSLEWLHVYGNSLNGTLPTEIGRLTNLQTFQIQLNSFSGTLPRKIGRTTSLTTIFA